MSIGEEMKEVDNTILPTLAAVEMEIGNGDEKELILESM